MQALLCKNLKLVAHPMTYAFAAFGVMLLIPSYPYTIAFFYVTLGVFFMFQQAREQRDLAFSALLPIRKSDNVRSAVRFTVGIELASLAFAVPWALLSANVNPNGSNLAGMDANVALFGLAFVLFAVFNAVFFPSFYRTAYKSGTSYLKACAAMMPLVIADVILPHIVPWLDGSDPRQFVVLAAGVVIFAAATALSERRSIRLFEKVDL